MDALEYKTEVNAGDAAASMLKATFPEGYAEFQLKQAVRDAIERLGKERAEQAIKEEMQHV